MAVKVNYKSIGFNIRTHRLRLNLTQAQLAELAGVSQQFLCSVESGKGIPSLHTALALCDALHVQPNELLLNAAEHDPDAPCTLRSDLHAFAGLIDELSLSIDDETAELLRMLPSADITPPFAQGEDVWPDSAD